VCLVNATRKGVDVWVLLDFALVKALPPEC